MSIRLLTVREAARQLGLHEKTVLRYIREGQLAATKVGKSYRVNPSALAKLGGVATSTPTGAARVTCILDAPVSGPERAAAVAAFLSAAAISKSPGSAPLRIDTVYDAEAGMMKIVFAAALEDARGVLELLHINLNAHP